jgi:ribosome biogenesis GTPase A
MQIQWYPGHMAKTERLIKDNLRYADTVIELCDARIPYSSKNPDTDKFFGRNKNIVVLNKCDLADPRINFEWIDHYRKEGSAAFLVDSVSGTGIRELLEYVKKDIKNKESVQKSKGRIHRAVKLMVVGIPNVGKSTFINKIAGKNTALTADRPGVTRNKQWVRINEDFSLLDMPGVLWPKFESEVVGQNLAFTGAIKSDILDIQSLALLFINKLRTIRPDVFSNRYKIEYDDTFSDMQIYDMIAGKRGFILKGGNIDYERCAAVLFDEYRAGALGRITLERPV